MSGDMDHNRIFRFSKDFFFLVMMCFIVINVYLL